MPHYNAYPPHSFMSSFGIHSPFTSLPHALMANSNSASSGASHHVIFNSQYSANLSEGPDQIIIGNGTY